MFIHKDDYNEPSLMYIPSLNLGLVVSNRKVTGQKTLKKCIKWGQGAIKSPIKDKKIGICVGNRLY